jgi:hypothetical protein
MNTPRDRLESPRETSKDRLYVSRESNKTFRHEQRLRLDAITTQALTEAQHLDDLKVNGKLLSRTVFIRRAVFMYCRLLLEAAKASNTAMLESELGIMLSMASPGKKAL